MVAYAALSLAACTTVLSSEDLTGPQTSGSWRDSTSYTPGIAYTLPKDIVLIRALVQPSTAEITVCAQAPTPIEDPDYQYSLAWRNSPFAADRIKIEKHPNTNVLKGIDVESLDKTDEFVFELARSAGSVAGLLNKERAVEAGACDPGEDKFALASVYMDPGDPADISAKLVKVNRIVTAFVQRQAKRCRAPGSPQAENTSREACEEYQRIYGDFRREQRPPIELRWIPPDIPPGHERPDCSSGICYRPLLPYMLYVSVAGASPVSHTFALPNNAPVIAMDVTRGIAITKTTRIGFDEHGQPTKFFIRKGNEEGTYGAEAVELAKLPGTVMNAYFGEFSKSLAALNVSLSPPGSVTTAKLEEVTTWGKQLSYATPEELAKITAEDGVEQRAAEDALAVKRADPEFVMATSNRAFLVQAGVDR